ncbi:hypothetical protein ACFE04_009170 [Oxalis oulophora]
MSTLMIIIPTSSTTSESLEFLFAHNVIRSSKLEPPALTWDNALENYAKTWANKRKSDCQLLHSFPEGEFEYGENIFWGSGGKWKPSEAVSVWGSEERFYDYEENECEDGQVIISGNGLIEPALRAFEGPETL